VQALRLPVGDCYGLAEKGFGQDQLTEKIINAEKSDTLDVLAYVAYAIPPMTREQRAGRARIAIAHNFNSKQQQFLEFVPGHYVGVGVDELDQEKLTPLLLLKAFQFHCRRGCRSRHARGNK
jgi:type I restriction enzyme R subunit